MKKTFLLFAFCGFLVACSSSNDAAKDSGCNKQESCENCQSCDRNAGPKVRPTAGVGVGVGRGGFRGVGGGVGLRI